MNQSKIKLLHLTSSLKMGGAERVLYEVVTSLDSAKYDQIVVYFHGGPFERQLKNNNIPLIQIKGYFFRYDPIFWIKLFLTIKRIKPDVMHTLLWMANVAGRFFGRWFKIPTYSVMHNNVTQDGSVRALIDYCTLSKKDKLIAVSWEVRDSLCARHKWLPAEQIPVIPNGIDVTSFAKSSPIARLKRIDFGLTKDHFVIGSVGRFVPVKQYDLLLHSFALLFKNFPNTRLFLVGTGPLEQKLRELAIALKIDSAVVFIINKPAIDYYGIFDAFVMSSAQEGISIALLEAMSSSLACVVTNSKYPMHTVLTHTVDGLVVESNNAFRLSQALQQVVTDTQLQQRLGTKAYNTVIRHYQKDQMVNQYDHFFSSKD